MLATARSAAMAMAEASASLQVRMTTSAIMPLMPCTRTVSYAAHMPAGGARHTWKMSIMLASPSATLRTRSIARSALA